MFPQYKKLQDQVFCLTEERDYFQSKFTEQVSEISALKSELQKARQQIQRLRHEILETSAGHACNDSEVDLEVVKARVADNSNAENDDDRSAASSLTSDDEYKTPKSTKSQADYGDYNDDDALSQNSQVSQESQDSGKDIRQSAEKLLQWAQYRTSVKSSSDRGGGSSSTAGSRKDASTIHSGSNKPPLLGSLENDDNDAVQDLTDRLQASFGEEKKQDDDHVEYSDPFLDQNKQPNNATAENNTKTTTTAKVVQL